MQHLVTACFVWLDINADVCQCTRTCLQCQKLKVCRHTIAPLGTFRTPDNRFDNILIDIVGPLSPSKGYNYLLTCIGRFTHWAEAFLLTNITAELVSQTFVNGWISRFGIPSTITTDRGKQFESTLWYHFMQLLGCMQIHTTVHHPIANGIIERFYRQV